LFLAIIMTENQAWWDSVTLQMLFTVVPPVLGLAAAVAIGAHTVRNLKDPAREDCVGCA
jgi:hypothetical protein